MAREKEGDLPPDPPPGAGHGSDPALEHRHRVPPRIAPRRPWSISAFPGLAQAASVWAPTAGVGARVSRASRRPGRPAERTTLTEASTRTNLAEPPRPPPGLQRPLSGRRSWGPLVLAGFDSEVSRHERSDGDDPLARGVARRHSISEAQRRVAPGDRRRICGESATAREYALRSGD